MNLKVLPYAAALVLPAVAAGAATTFVMQQIQHRNQPKKTPWYDVSIADETVKVLSLRL